VEFIDKTGHCLRFLVKRCGYAEAYNAWELRPG
jgi:hypothetical protein